MSSPFNLYRKSWNFISYYLGAILAHHSVPDAVSAIRALIAPHGNSNGAITKTNCDVTPVDANLCLSADFCIIIIDISPKPVPMRFAIAPEIALSACESVKAVSSCDFIASFKAGSELIASGQINIMPLIDDPTAVNDTIFIDHYDPCYFRIKRKGVFGKIRNLYRGWRVPTH